MFVDVVRRFALKITDWGLGAAVVDNATTVLHTACGSPSYAAPELLTGEGYVLFLFLSLSPLRVTNNPNCFEATALQISHGCFCSTDIWLGMSVVCRDARVRARARFHLSYNGPARDVWNCGVVLFALLCGRLPFADSNDAVLFRKIAAMEYVIPPHVSPEAKDLLQRILVADPQSRLTLADIRQHVWFGQLVHPTDPIQLPSAGAPWSCETTVHFCVTFFACSLSSSNIRIVITRDAVIRLQ